MYTSELDLSEEIKLFKSLVALVVLPFINKCYKAYIEGKTMYNIAIKHLGCFRTLQFSFSQMPVV